MLRIQACGVDCQRELRIGKYVERDGFDVFQIAVMAFTRLSVLFAEIRVQNLPDMKKEF